MSSYPHGLSTRYGTWLVLKAAFLPECWVLGAGCTQHSSCLHRPDLVRRGRRNARPHTDPAPHAAFLLEHGMTGLVDAERRLAHRAGVGTDPAGRALIRHASLGNEFQRANTVAVPSTLR